MHGLRGGIGGLWSYLGIVATGSQIGVGEARRIHGHYMITAEDLNKGAEFQNSVCKSSFGVDIHSLHIKYGGGHSSEGVRSKPYEILLQALIAKDINGLMNAMAMGEAAGKVAATASLNNRLPHQVSVEEAGI